MRLYKCLLLIPVICLACTGGKKNTSAKDGERMVTQTGASDSLLNFPLGGDLSGKSLQELRILRMVPYARQGYCIMEAELRRYFSTHLPGYDSLMDDRYELDGTKDSLPPITLSKDEQAFVDKIDALIEEKKKHNHVERNGLQLGNVANIVNLYQYKNLPDSFLSVLDKYNFAVIPTDNSQLYDGIENNDYLLQPSFITADLYLQLYHMYFSYVFKSLEQDTFASIAASLSAGMYHAATEAAANTADADTKSLAEYTAAFYAIPCYLLTGTMKPVPAAYAALVDKELKHIAAGQDDASEFLGTQSFGYSLFKPRGHYTRNDTFRRYFRAMMWLQTASFCRNTPDQFRRAIFMAALLNAGGAGGPLMRQYTAIYEPIVFLIGEPDNLSVNDIVTFLKNNNVSSPSAALQMQDKIDACLQDLAKSRNRIKPKVPVTCEDKINFMPQRYLFDNEILQEMEDPTPNAARAYPRGLDIFAVLGNKTAEDILLNEYKEPANWPAYKDNLDKLKTKFDNNIDWNKTVYNKWMYCLTQLQKKDAAYPQFMQSGMWDRKNLNTSLASWTDLKHDALLYSEQPEAAECGGAGPPPPVITGYVEPNVSFWKSMIELSTLTSDMLARNGLLSEALASRTKELRETATFLLSVSEKELKNQRLTDEEYATIEALGASAEHLTLSLIEPDTYLLDFHTVHGTDTSIAVVADVFTRNVPGCNKNGILHEAVGNANYIYVVVEVNGLLYLTRGTTFSYYEFVRPNRLSDDDWQRALNAKKDLPGIPQWIRDVVIPAKAAPTVDDKVFYSSGS